MDDATLLTKLTAASRLVDRAIDEMNRHVWIAIRIDHEDFWILGVFNDEQEAQRLCDAKRAEFSGYGYEVRRYEVGIATGEGGF